MLSAALTQLSPTMFLAARGRAIGRLIRGLTEGDPASWIILSGIVVIAGGWYGYKYHQSKKQ